MQRDANRPLYAGGLLLFFGFLAGSAAGIAYDQPSLGAIVGVAAAAVVAILLWLGTRRT